MGKTVYILTEGHWRADQMSSRATGMKTDVIGIFEDENTAYEEAVSRAQYQYRADISLNESQGEFIWTFNDSFPLEELYNHGVLYLSVGSEKTDSIVEYFTLELRKGELKE